MTASALITMRMGPARRVWSCRCAVFVGLCATAFAPVGQAMPVPGRHLAELCTVAPSAPVRCLPTVVEMQAQRWTWRADKASYTIEFPQAYKQAFVTVREGGRPAAQFLADHGWTSAQVFQFRETQPAYWELRFKAPLKP